MSDIKETIKSLINLNESIIETKKIVHEYDIVPLERKYNLITVSIDLLQEELNRFIEDY